MVPDPFSVPFRLSMNALTRHPSRWLIVIAAIGCAAGLLSWPETPQVRFLAVIIGVASPFTAYALARLLSRLAVLLMRAAHGHNWRQFSLRGLLAFTIICAIGSLIWSWTRPDIRYRRMRDRQQLAAAVELLGGSLDGNLIRLNGQVIYDGDLEYLASLPGAKEVHGVNLNGTGITDEVTKYMGLFPNLKNVSMNGCLAITDGALKHLHGNRKLRFLSAYDTQLTQAGVDSLKDANHFLLVHWGYQSRFMKGDPNAKASHPAPASLDH
jgi:hypothetical protein